MITSIDTDGNIRRIASPYSMKPFLEHLNMTSTDVDETIRFLLTAMPEFSIRGEGGGRKHSAGCILALRIPIFA